MGITGIFSIQSYLPGDEGAAAAAAVEVLGVVILIDIVVVEEGSF